MVGSDLDDTAWIEARIFSITVQVRIPSLICEYARPAHHVVMGSVIMAVDPEFRLKILNHGAEIRRKRGR